VLSLLVLAGVSVNGKQENEYQQGAARIARYNLRRRSNIKLPARFLSAVTADPTLATNPCSLQGGPSTATATTVVDLTEHLPPCAVIRQPNSEVHYDDVAPHGFAVDNAIFSHAWAPDATALFACGGPLAMGIRGCYMSMWA
jgi:hypothetical protein